ncbi:MAG: 2-amino-4-hydroxy-6-hydroxymethyldihydropteridine diphosphokinase [Gammaproteobacteria bacterium]|nr:2-amino-4-hydroxy-6-hydroxymethyldihydropteridine diphosphokinase [Gammaproteobacteria bacterium]
MGEIDTATAWIGLGSNLDDPAAQVSRALDELDAIEATYLLHVSSLYASPPMGPPDQPEYVNAVAGLLTTLAPEALLDALQAIEQAHGRVRSGQRWGPRTLDLDLLLYADLQLETARLIVPHPGLRQRAFVLHPLAEVAPELMVPGLGRVLELARACPADGLRCIGRAGLS